MSKITIHPVSLNIDDSLLHQIRKALKVELREYSELVVELDVTLSKLRLITQHSDAVVCRYQVRTISGRVIIVRSSGDSVVRAVLRAMEPLCTALDKERSLQHFKPQPAWSKELATRKGERVYG